jgi:hypothetical protein
VFHLIPLLLRDKRIEYTRLGKPHKKPGLPGSPALGPS